MLIEMLRKAIALGRVTDADRILTHAVSHVDERLRSPESIDEGQLELLSLEALKLSELQASAAWAKWVLETYRRSALLPPRTVAEGVSRLPPTELAALRDQLDDIVECAPKAKLSSAEIEGLARLETIRATLHGG
jgi:hypothetical protein